MAPFLKYYKSNFFNKKGVSLSHFSLAKARIQGRDGRGAAVAGRRVRWSELQEVQVEGSGDATVAVAD
ncbi:hypothetical protein ES332_A08G295000v1 [Gossypium tomentosum]|uniref:Uncharacterized protein n=1 Tax=Gossypium tomentosum TaxID=34277 RepID=A0A5D2PL05_GOSTO|nr:hypothetical protein ES332_A08G295000v1 [Gossypium tomentosum]